MNFNKYTINLSTLDITAHYLKQKKYNPKISLLQNVQGRGINDLIPYTEQKRVYSIRKLEYLDKVVLEKMILTQDKEIDDYLISYEFDEDKLPKEWITVMYK